jgi:phosphatidylglycerol:prolipoprotein diacylglycerol transferase
MLHYPQLNPIAFHLGPIPVHWYGIMYLVGFNSAWLFGLYRAKHSRGWWRAEQVSDLLLYVALGVIFGGRIGYILFYNLPAFVHQPSVMFKIWNGGMSFHGGLLGVTMAILLFCVKAKKHVFDVADFTVPLVPLGLATGRLGNFINGELVGRVTSVPWGMIYPQAGPLPRHPSEIYEFLLEGVLLFIVLWWYSSKSRPRMAVSALFLLSYGCVRCLAEFFANRIHNMVLSCGIGLPWDKFCQHR